MPRETRLYKALQRRGLKVEYVPGWSTRGSATFAPFGALAHWTAGPRTGIRPSLNVVVNGRAGLPGPLCHVFLDRNGVAVVVAAGRANHAGAGFFKGADGNTDLFGCECEWSGAPGELTKAQLDAYPKVMATFMDLGAQWIAGHDEYALPKGRKVDVGGYIHTLRKQTYELAAAPAGATPGGLTVSEADRIIKHINAVLLGGYTWQGKAHPGIGMVVEENQRRIDRIPGKVWDETKVRRNGERVSALQELADTKTLQLAANGVLEQIAQDGGHTLEEVRNAVAEGMNEALGNLTARVEVVVPEADGEVTDG